MKIQQSLTQRSTEVPQGKVFGSFEFLLCLYFFTESRHWLYIDRAGDPDIATTRAIVLSAIEAGADVVELGVPFSRSGGGWSRDSACPV